MFQCTLSLAPCWNDVSQFEVFRPKEVRAKSWAHAKLPSSFFAFGGEVMLTFSRFKMTGSNEFFNELIGFHSKLLSELGRCHFASRFLGLMLLLRHGCYPFKRDANFITDTNNALRFFVSILIELCVI